MGKYKTIVLDQKYSYWWRYGGVRYNIVVKKSKAVISMLKETLKAGNKWPLEQLLSLIKRHEEYKENILC